MTSLKGVVLEVDGCWLWNITLLWLLWVCEWHTGICQKSLLGLLQPCCLDIFVVVEENLLIINFSPRSSAFVLHVGCHYYFAASIELLALGAKQVISAGFSSGPIARFACCQWYHRTELQTVYALGQKKNWLP